MGWGFHRGELPVPTMGGCKALDARSASSADGEYFPLGGFQGNKATSMTKDIIMAVRRRDPV